MLIGVMSDSHDRLPMIDRALDLFRRRGAEALVHPGDVVAPFAAQRLRTWDRPLYIIYGNNDGERRGLKHVLPQIQDGPLFVELDGRTILLHHFDEWIKPADLDRADVVITGHTHEVANEVRDGKRFLNPGEACGWVTGRCTVALLDTETMTPHIHELSP
jgi:putative phosphoesterase